MTNMDYPSDETDLTLEQMSDLMADAEEVELVPAPLYELVRPVQSFTTSTTLVRTITPVTVGVTVGQDARQDFAAV